MHIVKIRRVGNSNVISLPKELERSGFTVGTSVVVEENSSGEVVITPASQVSQEFRAVARRVIAENREAFDMLATYDRGETVPIDLKSDKD
jgi:antitoxin component of MazEF toxin-antitoxin module